MSYLIEGFCVLSLAPRYVLTRMYLMTTTQDTDSDFDSLDLFAILAAEPDLGYTDGDLCSHPVQCARPTSRDGMRLREVRTYTRRAKLWADVEALDACASVDIFWPYGGLPKDGITADTLPPVGKLALVVPEDHRIRPVIILREHIR